MGYFAQSTVTYLWRIILGHFGLLCASVYLDAKPVELTTDDKAWLQANPTILFSYDPEFVPFSYRDKNGEFRGLDADFLAAIGKKLGVEFLPKHYDSWTQAYRAAEAGEVLMLTSTAKTAERRDAFAFSRPYVDFPVAILTRKEEKSFNDMRLLEGRRVAGAKNYAATLALKRNYPEIILIEYESIAEALQAVASGQADAALTNLVNASYEIRRGGLTGLKVAGVAPITFYLRYAVRQGEPQLLRVLDAAVASLEEKELQAIIAPWVTLESGSILSRRQAAWWVAGAVAVFGLVFALISLRNRALRKKLKERMRFQRELELSNQSLAHLNEEKAGLMSMAAHDLRNPLSGLLLSIDLLKQAPIESREVTLQRMETLVQQMMHMVRNLLDVQALESGTRKITLERISVRTALGEALETADSTATAKQIKLELAAINPVLAVKSDRSALRQICDNLLSNAVKYSPIGSTVQLSAEKSGKHLVRLIIRDHGPGVKPEDMPRLFLKFTNLNTRTTGGEASTGLGLSIVKELTQRLGGRVWCESKPGQGATFIVELPEAGAGER